MQFSAQYEFAYVVDRDGIAKLWKILSELAPVSASALCADDGTRSFATLEDLLNYENDLRGQIRTLSMKAIGPHVTMPGRVEFRDECLSYEISGRDENALLGPKQAIKAVLAGTRAWYSPIALLSLTFSSFVLFAVVSLIAVISASNHPPPVGAVSIGSAIWTSATLVGFVVLWILCTRALTRLQRRYFPRRVIAIGQAAKRDQNDNNVRIAIIVGSAVSIFAAVVVEVSKGWLLGLIRT